MVRCSKRLLAAMDGLPGMGQKPLYFEELQGWMNLCAWFGEKD